MKVRALVGFVATIDGVKYRAQAGDELLLPDGADWLRAGLVEKVAPPVKTKTATRRKKVKSDGG